MKTVNGIFIAAAFALLLLACESNDPGASLRSENTDVLGMVVPNLATSEVSKLILLEDGRKINPVSGMNDFSRTNYGTQLLLSFTETGTNKGVIDAEIKKYSPASDSTFVPTHPSDSSGTGDSLKIVLEGVYSGKFYHVSNDSTSGSRYHEGQTSVTFSKVWYQCTPSINGYPLGGAGTYVKKGYKLKFNDIATTWPKGTDMSRVLQGEYNYDIKRDSLTLWTAKNGYYVSFTMKKQR